FVGIAWGNLWCGAGVLGRPRLVEIERTHLASRSRSTDRLSCARLFSHGLRFDRNPFWFAPGTQGFCARLEQRTEGGRSRHHIRLSPSRSFCIGRLRSGAGAHFTGRGRVIGEKPFPPAQCANGF